MGTRKITEKQWSILFVIFTFLFFFVWSIIQPVGAAPDEPMKYDIVNYLVKHGKIPHGGDPEIRNVVWGISYAFSPILSYMISAVFVKIVSFFTSDLYFLYIGARFTSVLCATGMVIYIIKISKMLFKTKRTRWSFILLSSMLPQMVFLGSYLNNDSLALFSISIIIYAWLIGIESGWNRKSCIYLGIGIGICALSYYNAYGYILTSMILYVVSFVICKKDRFDMQGFIKKGLMISLIVIAICGWWFIRSAIIYDGDFLGLSVINEYAEKYAIPSLKPSEREYPAMLGQSLKYMLIDRKWIKLSGASFIGLFGFFSISMPMRFYKLYFLVLAGSGFGTVISYANRAQFKKWIGDKKRIIIDVIFVLNIIIPLLLSIYYSYCSDFQPQGRYLMPMLIPLMYFVTIGLNYLIDNLFKEKVQKFIYYLFYLYVIASPIYCLMKVITVYSVS